MDRRAVVDVVVVVVVAVGIGVVGDGCASMSALSERTTSVLVQADGDGAATVWVAADGNAVVVPKLLVGDCDGVVGFWVDGA